MVIGLTYGCVLLCAGPRQVTKDMISTTPSESGVVPSASEKELTMPKTLVALADNIDDNEDDGVEGNSLEWSPHSAQSIPSLLDDENHAKIALHRSNSELTLEPCLDPAIIETSQGLFLPHLVPKEGWEGVELAPPLRRFTTPPTTVKTNVGVDHADATAVATVTPPTTPESRSSHRSSSIMMSEDDEKGGARCERRVRTASIFTAKTPKRSNRGSSINTNSNKSSSDVIEVTFNEIQRKKNLRIKNFFRRLARSVRKV
jgi:hypothetical protein